MSEENLSQYSETALASLTLPNVIFPALELVCFFKVLLLKQTNKSINHLIINI